VTPATASSEHDPEKWTPVFGKDLLKQQAKAKWDLT
jgi:hypothetical protein